MKKKLLNYSIVIFLTLLLLAILLNSKLVLTETLNAINIWITKVFPSLFPFFIISDILINYNIIYYLNIVLKKFININENAFFIFIMSLLSGFPSNAKYTKELFDQKLINKLEAENILIWTFFSNPLFIINMTKSIFNNSKITIIILISHYLGNIFLKFIFHKKISSGNHIIPKKNLGFQSIFKNSITKTLDTLFLILGTITCFIILNALISKIFHFHDFIKVILSGTLELTQGLNNLSSLNISVYLKCLIAISFLSFGGLSVHMQIKSILEKTPISYKKFLISRIYHVIISGLIGIILLIILKT